MKKICSYCGVCYGDTGAPPPEGLPRDAVTHGACTSCFCGLMEELDRRQADVGGGEDRRREKARQLMEGYEMGLGAWRLKIENGD